MTINYLDSLAVRMVFDQLAEGLLWGRSIEASLSAVRMLSSHRNLFELGAISSLPVRGLVEQTDAAGGLLRPRPVGCNDTKPPHRNVYRVWLWVLGFSGLGFEFCKQDWQCFNLELD
jgi:hypothetical protein